MTTRRKALPSPQPEDFGPDPADFEGTLKMFGGSESDNWNDQLISQAVEALWTANSTQERREKQTRATIAALAGIAPQDEFEGMLAAQLLGAHHAAMECYRRAMRREQPSEARQVNLVQANKLSRTTAILLDALNKHRGKGQQKVTVEHVHVHAGGQAIVGAVEAPGGLARKAKEQPHAPQVGSGPVQLMRRQNPQRATVPLTIDEERALPDARRRINRSTTGK